MLMEIIGRDRELEAITTFLDREQDGPQVLLLEGEAGIGKTTLWNQAATAAEPAHRVLRASPREIETRISFASIGDLLTDVVEEAADRLPGAQRRALEMALLMTDDDGPQPEPQAIAFACLSILRVLARARPVLVAVDDIQWLDRPSASVLVYAARRLRGEDIRFLLARRTDGTAEVPGLGTAIPEEALRRIVVGPLSAGAIQRLVRERLDVTLSRPLLHRIRTTSDGNPFYALELVRAHARAGDAGIDTPLPVPESLSGLVTHRLEALPDETRQALTVAALLSDPAVDLVTKILESVPAFVPAIEAGIIDVVDGRIRFTHPLLSSSLASRVEPTTARGIHRRISMLVVDPEERARHLAQSATHPDPGVAEALDQGADHACRRGAPAIAAELLERALKLTDADDPARYARLLAASEATRQAGDWPRARALAETAIAIAEEGNARARALLLLGLSSSDALEVCLSARAEAPADPSLEARIHLALSDARFGVSFPLAYEDACAALEAAERAKDMSLVSEALALAAWLEGALTIGDPHATVERARRLGHRASDEESNGYASRFVLANLQMWRDQHDLARDNFESELARAVSTADLFGQAHARLHLAQVEWRAGAWDRAATHAREGLDEWPADEPKARGSLLWIASLIAVHQGKLSEARAMAHEALATAEYDRLFGARNQWVLGIAASRTGQLESALDCLERARDIFAELGVVEPGMLLFAPDLIEAYVTAGRLDEADEFSAAFERQGAVLGRPRACAIGARGRGLVLAAKGELDAAQAAFNDALGVDATWRVPLERGRTLLALGAVERRARHLKQARATLGQALDLFDALGAEPFAEDARRELARIGGRVPSADGLTRSEARVAELVAEGKTNKAVAAELVVSIHTVEAALTQVYRKLGVRSRTEMARKLTNDN